jgi:hypothetical protein
VLSGAIRVLIQRRSLSLQPVGVAGLVEPRPVPRDTVPSDRLERGAGDIGRPHTPQTMQAYRANEVVRESEVAEPSAMIF